MTLEVSGGLLDGRLALVLEAVLTPGAAAIVKNPYEKADQPSVRKTCPRNCAGGIKAVVLAAERKAGVTVADLVADLRRAIDDVAQTQARHGATLDRIVSLLTPAANEALDPADRDLCTNVVRVVAHRKFAAVELRNHAAVDPELARAIQAADIDIDDARQLGHWLRRMAAAGAIEGVALVRNPDYDRRGIVWALRVVAGFSTQNSPGKY